MVKSKKQNTLSFKDYEKERWAFIKHFINKKILRKPIAENVSENTKENTTLKTAWNIFKEAWTQTGKDFKKTVLYKVGESSVVGLSPYCQSLLFGALPGIMNGGATNFFGAATLEALRKRVSNFFRFKSQTAAIVLKDTHTNMAATSIYEDILHKPRPYFKDNAPAALSGVVGEITSAKNILLTNSVDCLSKAVVFAVSSASLFSVDPVLAGSVLGMTAVTAEFGGFMNKYYRKKNSKMRSFINKIGKQNSDSIKNTPLVQDTNRILQETQTMRSRREKSSKITQNITYAKGKAYLKMSTAINIGMEMLIMTAAYLDIVKTGDIGRFALISASAWQMMSYGNMLSEIWNSMQAETFRLSDASQKLKTPKELEHQQGKEKLSANDTKIRIQNIRFAYPLIKDVTDMRLVENKDIPAQRGNDVINNLSIEFDKGELISVVGTSGNGKSTLMSLIRHDYDVQDGKIFIGNHELKNLSDEEINRQISFVDQKVHFFDESIAYNLKYFNPDAQDKELWDACKRAGLDKDIERLSDGLRHKIGQDGSKLSGGQQQRLALARTFLTDTPIIIMDEPTTGLDPKLSYKIVKSLKEMSKNKTVIMVTHNPTEIALADRVVVIENGQVSGDGRPQDLIKTNDFLRTVLTKEDIRNKKRLYNISINGQNQLKETAILLNEEDSGKVLTDNERLKKRKLLEENKQAYIQARKNALLHKRIKDKKSNFQISTNARLAGANSYGR